MKKILAFASTVALLVPTFALAAYDDVTLTTDTVLSVNGITLNVSGSSAVIESITVNATNFSVTLPVNSTFQVTAPGLEQINASTATGQTSFTCNSSQSLIKYAPTTSSVTVTITPSATLCSSTSSGGGGSTGGGGGGGGGGSSTPAIPATPAIQTSTTTQAVPATPATPATPTNPASGLSATQIQSILDVLASFNADAEVIAKVRASLEGTTVTGSVTSTSSVFKSNLTVGSLGSEVKALQEYLNSHGYTVAASGPGSPGNETTRFGALTRAALIEFQKANGITPAAGYFGAKTRAAVNSGS